MPRHSQLTLEVSSLDDIFDRRDHTRIPKRGLDQDWLEYIFERLESHPRTTPIRLVLHLSHQLLIDHKPREIAANVEGQLARRQKILSRKLRENFRLGRISLFYGLLTLGAFIGLSEITHVFASGALAPAFREGFLIIGWVALWRPVEILLYDWWPIVAERKKITQLLAGEIIINSAHDHGVDEASDQE